LNSPPLVCGWEAWTPDDVTEIVDDEGAQVRVWHEVEAVDGELVTFTESFDSPAWDGPRVSRSTLRFRPAGAVDAFLGAAGFAVVERYGDWDRSLMTPSSREIITVARRARSA
jgi:hypothetical protein